MARISVLDAYGFASNCYVVQSGGRYIVVDPSVGLEALYNQRPEFVGTLPECVLLTHVHYDHVEGVESYAAAGVKICISAEDGKYLCDPTYNCARFLGAGDWRFLGAYTPLYEGDVITFGDESLTVLKTPGHTLGSVCYLGDGYAFVGDTIFEGGGYGRFDLPGGDVSALRQSLLRILALPDDTILYPGHGGIDTVERSKKYF